MDGGGHLILILSYKNNMRLLIITDGGCWCISRLGGATDSGM